MTATLLADTMLLEVPENCNPANRYGGSNTINIGQPSSQLPGASRSRVLVRFRLTQAMLDAIQTDGPAYEGSLGIQLRASGGGCGGACPNAAATFDVFPVRNDWLEGFQSDYSGAEWCNRRQSAAGDGVRWDANGADAAQDRGMLVIASATVTDAQAQAAGPVEVPFTLDAGKRAELTRWINPTTMELSLIAISTSGGTLFLLSRDAAGAAASQLKLTACVGP